MYISTQGLVKVVKRLEAELGTNLFIRTHQGIIPTADGTYFYEEMKDVIEKCRSVKKHFSAEEKAEKLRFAYTQGIMSMLTIDYIDKFKTEFPNIELILEEGTDKFIQNKIINGQADIGIISGPFDDSHLQSLFFTKVKNVVALNTNDVLAQKSKIAYADFNNRKVAMIAQASNTYRQLLDKIHASGAKPAQIYESDQLMFNHQRASENMCIGQSIELFTKQFAYPNTVIKNYEDDDFYWETYFVWLKSKPYTQTMDRFIDFTKQFLEMANAARP